MTDQRAQRRQRPSEIRRAAQVIRGNDPDIDRFLHRFVDKFAEAAPEEQDELTAVQRAVINDHGACFWCIAPVVSATQHRLHAHGLPHPSGPAASRAFGRIEEKVGTADDRMTAACHILHQRHELLGRVFRDRLATHQFVFIEDVEASVAEAFCGRKSTEADLFNSVVAQQLKTLQTIGHVVVRRSSRYSDFLSCGYHRLQPKSFAAEDGIGFEDLDLPGIYASADVPPMEPWLKKIYTAEANGLLPFASFAVNKKWRIDDDVDFTVVLGAKAMDDYTDTVPAVNSSKLAFADDFAVSERERRARLRRKERTRIIHKARRIAAEAARAEQQAAEHIDDDGGQEDGAEDDEEEQEAFDDVLNADTGDEDEDQEAEEANNNVGFL